MIISSGRGWAVLLQRGHVCGCCGVPRWRAGEERRWSVAPAVHFHIIIVVVSTVAIVVVLVVVVGVAVERGRDRGAPETAFDRCPVQVLLKGNQLALQVDIVEDVLELGFARGWALQRTKNGREGGRARVERGQEQGAVSAAINIIIIIITIDGLHAVCCPPDPHTDSQREAQVAMRDRAMSPPPSSITLPLSRSQQRHDNDRRPMDGANRL